MKPLADIRILAIEQYGAGPFGSSHLAELGAEVIKIEDPAAGGDIGRYVPPYAEGGDSLFFETFNRGKRSIALDLGTDAGRSVFTDLVRVSDAVYSNLRGDVPAKLGITYDALKTHNPLIVCCSLSGYGRAGPRAAAPGYDYLVQGLSGWMSLTGEPDGPPSKTGPSLVDWSGGFVAALALVCGVHAARRDGVGLDCDVSLFDTALSMLGYLATWHLNAGYLPARTHHSAHPSIVPFQAFAAADGWLVVACPKDKFWRRLAEVLERPYLADDPRYATMASRHEHRDELAGQLSAIFATRTAADWLARLGAGGVPCAPVLDVAQALADPQVAARELVVETEHPRFGRVRTLASPVRVGAGAAEQRRAPRLGEDLSLLSALLGYEASTVAKLRSAGAFGPADQVGEA